MVQDVNFARLRGSAGAGRPVSLIDHGERHVQEGDEPTTAGESIRIVADQRIVS